MSADLEAAVVAAQKATLQFHALLAVHEVTFQEFPMLLVKPAGLVQAHTVWTASMVEVMRALARRKGIPDASKMSGRDLVALTNRAYDLVMS